MRSGDSTIGGRCARDESFDETPREVGGVLLLRSDRDRPEDEKAEESPAVSESNLVTNAARARRSSSSCCHVYDLSPSSSST
jgi:hypothetical protein